MRGCKIREVRIIMDLQSLVGFPRFSGQLVGLDAKNGRVFRGIP